MEYSFVQLKKEFDGLGIELTDEKLVKLNLLSSDGEVTYEGILLSDQCTHGVKLIDYTEGGKGEEVTGSLITQYITLKEKMIQISTEMKYPIKALLEVLKNMIMHRDYTCYGDSIIRIYKDRIEFTSLGGLIANLTVEGIELGISVLRNPNLMKMFQEIGITKGNGKGIQEILSAYKEYKLKPVFKSIGGVFQVILPKPEYTVNGKVIEY